MGSMVKIDDRMAQVDCNGVHSYYFKEQYLIRKYSMSPVLYIDREIEK